jgi:hypothetical protein
MAGDTANASLWADADVYVAPLGTASPASVSTAWSASWDLVGLLDGEAGFVHAREEEVTDHYAWGGILVRTARRNFKQTVTFTALEDNDTTRELIWPGSSASAYVVPRPTPILLGLETREGFKVKRLITAGYAEVTVNGDITDSESDLTRYELLATIFPDASTDPATIWDVQEGDFVS